MPMPTNSAKNPASPLASFDGHHIGVRVPGYEAADPWSGEYDAVAAASRRGGRVI
jgi:hypothetical protein